MSSTDRTYLCILDQLSNVPEEKSTGEEYFAIFKNLALFLEYLTTNFFADQVQILEKDYEEKMAEIEGHGTDEVLPFEYRKYDRVALTPEDVAEQILKVEHELEEYNDNGEL